MRYTITPKAAMMLRGFAERQETPIPMWVLDAIQNGIKTEEKVSAAVKQETIEVPVEAVRELKRIASRGSHVWREVALCIDMMPDPPKPSVVEECAKVFHVSLGFGIAAVKPNEWKPGMRAALRRYRELGCPEIDE